MATVIDGKVNPGRAVRTLLYESAEELDGDTITTTNGGRVECELGTVAFKAGFVDMKQLGPSGWVDC